MSHDATQVISDYAATLDRVGIDRKTAGRYQKLAEVPEDKFEAALHSEKIRPSTAQIIKLAQGGTIASLHTGDEESYTPSNYLESAREVMGGFDLDPASNEMAQANVQAAKYFTVDDDGLSQDWSGRVWMNPPYTARVINGFIAKLVEHYQSGDVTEAICLTNNNTDTSWFHGAVDNGDAVCFTAGRINFLKRDGSKSSPTNGQCFIYFGPNVDKFKEVFSAHGIVMVKA